MTKSRSLRHDRRGLRRRRSGRESRPGPAFDTDGVRWCRPQNYISDTPRAACEKRAPRPIQNIKPFSSKWPRRGSGWPIRRRSLALPKHPVPSLIGAIESASHLAGTPRRRDSPTLSMSRNRDRRSKPPPATCVRARSAAAQDQERLYVEIPTSSAARGQSPLLAPSLGTEFELLISISSKLCCLSDTRCRNRRPVRSITV